MINIIRKKRLLYGLLCCLILFSCNRKEDLTPQEVLSSFFDALAANDINRAKEFATMESGSLLDMIQLSSKGKKISIFQNYNKENFSFGEAKIEGDLATVPVKEKASDGLINFKLKKIDNEWKVVLDKGLPLDLEKGETIDPQQKIDDAMKDLNKVNMDSMKKAMQESMPPFDTTMKE